MTKRQAVAERNPKEKAAGKRARTPKKTETDVLVDCRRVCCLCYGLNQDPREKRGQLAHINHNRTDNRYQNLAWLCLFHHDEYDGSTSQSKGLTPQELRVYLDMTYQAVRDGRLPGQFTGPGALLDLEVVDNQVWVLANKAHREMIDKFLFLLHVRVCNVGTEATGIRQVRLSQAGVDVGSFWFPPHENDTLTLVKGGHYSIRKEHSIFGLHVPYLTRGGGHLVGPGDPIDWAIGFMGNPLFPIDPKGLPACPQDKALDSPLLLELIPVKGPQVAAEVGTIRLQG